MSEKGGQPDLRTFSDHQEGGLSDLRLFSDPGAEKSTQIRLSPFSGTVVLGVGNLVHADDGLGVHALRLLQNDTRVPADVRLIEGGTLGLELIGYVSQAARLLVLDAIDANQKPGGIIRMTGSELSRVAGGSNVHQLGLADLMNALRLLDSEPGEVVLLGIQPESVEWSATLTASVEAALPELVEAAIQQLETWSEVTQCITA